MFVYENAGSVSFGLGGKRSSATRDVDVRSAVPQALKINLQIAGSAESVTVQGEAGDLLENDPTFHTDIDRSLFDKLPLESASSELSSLVTLSAPGIAADSNGLFHGMGDHASNSFSLDGQPITDQQSKVFSNQIPLDAVQSMTVIGGARYTDNLTRADICNSDLGDGRIAAPVQDQRS